jgi:hypothetical protein
MESFSSSLLCIVGGLCFLIGFFYFLYKIVMLPPKREQSIPSYPNMPHNYSRATMTQNIKIIDVTEEIAIVMEKRITDRDPPVCLYCGEFMKDFSDDRDIYFECDCIDAIRAREITIKIVKLQQELPKTKFEVIKREYLIKKRW